MKTKAVVAVRLEGGIGDHILGLRLLPFVRQEHPDAYIILYSDAGGGEAQHDIARMCPDANKVLVLKRLRENLTLETMGRLEDLIPEDLKKLRGADYFYDAWGMGFFLEASRALNVPFYEILAHRPTLRIPSIAIADGDRLLADYSDNIFVGLNIAKYGAAWVEKNTGAVRSLVLHILENPRVVVLNFYARRFTFAHWPDTHRVTRAAFVAEEADEIARFGESHERIIPVVDAPIQTVTAMLVRCQYFIGVDNGIKHLAWAFNIPHTVFMPELPNLSFTLRWVPDYHRVLRFHCEASEITAHVNEAARYLHQ